MFRLMSVILCSSALISQGHAAETVADCQNMLATGRYQDCLTATTKAVEERSYGEEWPILKARAELALGKYPDALVTIAGGIERYSWSVRLRLLEYECAAANGRKDQAANALVEVEKMVSTAAWRYTDADDLVALGEIALALGVDARKVQEGYFERARRNYSSRPDGFIAAAKLALSKGDVAFAAELTSAAIKDFPEDPEILFLQSEALRSSDQKKSTELLQQVLKINPSHFSALARLVETHILGEQFSEAEKVIQQMLSVNPHFSTAHALQAVIYHLRNAAEPAAASRAEALRFSASDPKVDYLIGRLLSARYRFVEGAASQRRALEADPDYVPAKVQLAQDLLRLGQEEEGWKLAEEAHSRDGYDTNLFNLLQLKDSLSRFTTVSTEHFRIRMEKQEAAVYGHRVAELLETEWAELTARYEFTPEVPVYVEIYSRADDFAVRTFGIPDVAGFLGVCFGRVVTANSPATRKDSPSSWESVLWHEFCHVITLQKTANRIPRWLSEGISVYEERRTDARWGQEMNAEFRDRILQDRVTPISQLSSAFLNAESGEDLNFAYFQSSMVVEHLTTVHGIPALNAVLTDLHSGLQINDALGRNTGGLEELESSFREFLLAKAKAFAEGMDFSDETFREAMATDLDSVREFLKTSPNSFPALLAEASMLIEAEQFDAAESVLKALIERVPDDRHQNGPRVLLAALYRRQNRSTEEMAVLTDHLNRTADDLNSAMRLQELCEAASLPERVLQLGEAILGIDPFQVESIQKSLAAAKSLQQTDAAVSLLNSLLQLKSDDAARIHYQIALLEQNRSPEKCRRHVLEALELAPRFREAHRLLLTLTPPTETKGDQPTVP